MCGRFTLHTPAERLARQFNLELAKLELAPRYNISPSQPVPVVRELDGSRELALLTWGLIPSWAKQAKTGYSLINARAETVASKPAFRAAYRQRRCLIPADGFYEWWAGPNGKQPYYIGLRDGGLFAFAGLWEHWEGESDGAEIVESCAIIVTEANELVRPIHDRMPVIIGPDDYGLWLDHSRFDAERLKALLKPYPADQLQAYQVSSRVNNPKNNDEHCIAPLV